MTRAEKDKLNDIFDSLSEEFPFISDWLNSLLMAGVKLSSVIKAGDENRFNLKGSPEYWETVKRNVKALTDIIEMQGE